MWTCVHTCMLPPSCYPSVRRGLTTTTAYRSAADQYRHPIKKQQKRAESNQLQVFHLSSSCITSIYQRIRNQILFSEFLNDPFSDLPFIGAPIQTNPHQVLEIHDFYSASNHLRLNQLNSSFMLFFLSSAAFQETPLL